jgi:hypothetical protein
MLWSGTTTGYCSVTLVTRLSPLQLFSGADLSGLLELPQSLDSICVGGNAFGDAAAPVLAQLTQLNSLSLGYSPGFTDAGLEQLTNLDLGCLSV